MRNHEREARIFRDEVNAALGDVGWGVKRSGSRTAMTQADKDIMDELNNALHNRRKVEEGEITVPEGYERVYGLIRDRYNVEEAATLDFDPNMATVQDYAYRGWKPLEGFENAHRDGNGIITDPRFRTARNKDSYLDMRKKG